MNSSLAVRLYFMINNCIISLRIRSTNKVFYQFQNFALNSIEVNTKYLYARPQNFSEDQNIRTVVYHVFKRLSHNILMILSVPKGHP